MEIVKASFYAIEAYTHQPPVHIQCCRGFALSSIREWLLEQEERYWCGKVEFVKIEDPLQGLLEKRLSKYLGRYGIPNNSGKGGHRISFDDMIEWVKEDPTRVKHVKTGWKSWIEKYASLIG